MERRCSEPVDSASGGSDLWTIRLRSGRDDDSDRPWPNVGSKDSTDLADQDLGSGSDPAGQRVRQSLSGVAAVKVVQGDVDRRASAGSLGQCGHAQFLQTG
jgi:hypothetical protein